MRRNNYQDIKTVLVGGILVVSVGAYFIGRTFFASPENSDGQSDLAAEQSGDKQQGREITPDMLQKKMNSGENIRVIDIRPVEEYRVAHLPSSLSLPLGALSGFAPEKDELVVIIFAANDQQSFETAKNILDQKSFAYFFLQGGLEAWKAGGHQTVSFGDPSSFVDQSKITYISPNELKTLLADPQAKIFLLDVQTTENFAKNHLKGATNIPLSQIEKRIREIPPAKLVIAYGENELISFQAGVRLSDLNILAVKTLSGNDHLSPTSPLPLQK